MASRLQDVISRGTRALQPLATLVAPGTLYYVTDEQVIERSSGTAWESYSPAGVITRSNFPVPPIMLDIGEPREETLITPFQPGYTQLIRQIGITIDGGGSPVTLGIKGYKSFPVDGIIVGNRLLADQSGSVVIDIWKDIFANYPPTVADTITASAKPTLTAQDHSEDNTLTGWIKAVKSGDVFGFKVDSASILTRVTLELSILIY